MSKTTNLTRDEAVAIVGEDAARRVEAAVIVGEDDYDDTVEFSASVRCIDAYGYDRRVVAYYYPTQEQLDEAGEDLGNVPWVIDHYDVR